MAFQFKNEIKKLIAIIKRLDKKVVIVFISVAVLQTVSWYYTSRRFFRINIHKNLFYSDPNAPLYEYLYWFIGDFFTLFIIPLLIILYFFKERPGDFGIRLGDWRTGLKITVIFLAFMLPILWFVSSTQAFASKYPHLHAAKSDWLILIIYETGMLIYMFAWEFIWRGYMLFGLEEKFGYYAVLIQMIPFVILHNGKPDIETFSSIIGGIALGILAFRTRSFIYGVIVHFGIMLGIDILGSARYRTSEFGIGIDTIINIIQKIF